LRDFCPSRPWLSKRTAEVYIAAEALDYVDDNRTAGHSYEATWQASTRLAKGYSYLGIQDATRKRLPPSKEPGPWAGMIVWTKGDVMKSVSQDRRDKTKAVLAALRAALDLASELGGGTRGLDRKALERAAGFLIYVSRA
jgi:hypothetical protein